MENERWRYVINESRSDKRSKSMSDQMRGSKEDKPLSKKKLWTFRLIAILFPFVLLFLFETVLRICDYGSSLDLFIEYKHDARYLVMNPEVSKRYFSQHDNATIGNEEPFLKQKNKNTKRFFVLGESTTIGYPYLHNGSFHRWLQYRLMHTYSNTNFEIINLSLTAVNSFTVRDMAEELKEYEPDAVLIYTGHNEYYGALGVASTAFIAKSPSIVRLVIASRRYRTVQFINQIISGIQSIFRVREVNQRENLMKRMAATLDIPLGSDRYTHGVEQFKENINHTLQTLNEQDIPVFISTVISNEKDMKPFISDTIQLQNNALRFYREAMDAYEKEEYVNSKEKFVKAKELDMLRFRAPALINQYIRALSKRYEQVSLVDMQQIAEDHSPHGIIGSELLLEHVHPNLLGYALLSDGFYKALTSRILTAKQTDQEMDFSTLVLQMPITSVDSLKASFEIMMLMEGWPFLEPMATDTATHVKSVEEELAGALAVQQLAWGEAMKRLLNYYLSRDDAKKSLLVSKALMLEYSNQKALYLQSGKFALNVDYLQEAIVYLKRAFALESDIETAKLLFITLLKTDRSKEALPYIEYAIINDRRNASLVPLKQMVEQIVLLKKRYGEVPDSHEKANEIASAYLRFANADAATLYVKLSLRLAPGNAQAIAMQKEILNIKAKPYR